MLNGTIIKLDRDNYGFDYRVADSNHPIMYRHVWPIGWVQRRGMSYCRIEDAIGKPATVDDGRVNCYLGNGNSIIGGLVNGGATTAVIFEQTKLEPPKAKTETRWHNGRWEKYLKTKGWVACATS